MREDAADLKRWTVLFLFAASCGGERLSGEGLYQDIATRTLAEDVVAYTPAFELWSDDAQKSRWIKLPSGGEIDKSDPEHWRFPVGTKLFKQFERDGVLIETRMIERASEGEYRMIAFVWNEDNSDAEPRIEGVENAKNTAHDVPEEQMCIDCHRGEPSRVLGYSAMQLEETVTSSIGQVLGYLHANCGTCHSDQGAAWEDTQLDLRLKTSEIPGAFQETAIYKTSIDAGISSWRTSQYEKIVVPGNPDRSALLARMNRTGKDRMPPIATEVIDEIGVELVREWIQGLAE